MTASLFNNQNGNFANVVDGYVYPQMIGYALRAPTTQDIYPPGTRWQDNSVNPAVQYYTTGAGIWNELPNSSFGVSSVTGTANQILASPTTGSVILSLIGPYTPATYTAHGVLVGEGTSSIVALATGTAGQLLTSGGASADPTWTTATFPATAGTTGTILRSNGTNWVASTDTYPNTVAAGDILIATAANTIGSLADVATGQLLTSGGVGVAPAYTASPSVTGSITAGTTLTATSGAITATNGNLVLGTAGNKLSIATGANASIGTSAAMTAGTITISTTAVTASSKIFLTANTLAGTPGTLSAPVASITAGTSFVITSSSNTDTSTVNWLIIN